MKAAERSLVSRIVYKWFVMQAAGFLKPLQVMRMILENKDGNLPPELVCLGINFAANARCAQIICEGKGLHFILKKALKTQDSLLIKMVRNLSQVLLDFSFWKNTHTNAARRRQTAVSAPC